VVAGSGPGSGHHQGDVDRVGHGGVLSLGVVIYPLLKERRCPFSSHPHARTPAPTAQKQPRKPWNPRAGERLHPKKSVNNGQSEEERGRVKLLPPCFSRTGRS